jgi:rhodanese-related sulfurtransferase
MKRNLFFKLLFVGIIIFNFSTSKAQTVNLELDKFISKYKSTPKSQLLDVRTPGEWASGKFSSSECINFQDADFKSKISKLDKSKPIFVYCAVGGRSSKASKILEQAGFKEIYNLTGAGYNQLAQKGLK